MKYRKPLFIILITMMVSCKSNNDPCLALMAAWGGSVTALDGKTHQNLLKYLDSFEVKQSSGEFYNPFPDFSDSSFFLESHNAQSSTLYFRIKPSTNIDTIVLKGHTVLYDEGSCSGNVYKLDSVFVNNHLLDTSYTFYYTR